MSDQTVSIVVPAYNDSEGVRTTIECIKPQLADSRAHLAVVDNGSTDETPSVIEEYTNDQVSLHHETGIQSSYAARNTGIQKTDGEILAFVDADMTVPSDWLESALETFRALDADYMGCNVELTLPDEPTIAARYDYHTGFPIGQYIEHHHFAGAGTLFVRRAVFKDVGLFDPRLVSGGDKEFGNRVHEAGYDLHFAQGVTLSHPTRNSMRALVRKDLRVGRGLCQLQRHYPDRYGTPGIPPRPSGVRSPDRGLSIAERFLFGALSMFLTAVRGIGYYREYLFGGHRDDIGDVPSLG